MTNTVRMGIYRSMRFGDFYSGVIAIALCILMFAAQNTPALAQDNVKKLTQQNVKLFIERTTEVTTGDNAGLSAEKIEAYLDKHLDKRARFKSVMRYHIPGMPPQEASLSLDKDEFMESIFEGSEATEGYENLIEIKEIKISSKGDKAFVKTISTEYASMPVPTENGSVENVPMEGISECTQILSVHKGIIQMYNADCVTNIQFLEY